MAIGCLDIADTSDTFFDGLDGFFEGTPLGQLAGMVDSALCIIFALDILTHKVI